MQTDRLIEKEICWKYKDVKYEILIRHCNQKTKQNNQNP